MKPVDDAAREPAGERARQRGRARRGERGAVRGVRPRLGREQERGAELRRRGAGREHGRDAAPSADAAGRDERQVDVGARHEPQQRQQPAVRRFLAVHERRPVAARLHALDARARRRRRRGRLRASSGSVTVTHTSAPAARRPADDLGRRAAERERDDRRPASRAAARAWPPTPSSSKRGSPASGPKRSTCARTASGSAAGAPGDEQVDPERRSRSARAYAAMSSPSASAAAVARRRGTRARPRR